MSQQTTYKRDRKPKAADRGAYRLGVFFVDHKSDDGRAFYFYSNSAQDRANTSINRLKQLVAVKWKGKVNWAGLYYNHEQIAEYKDGVWS